jgi:hypothetical protein
MMIRRVGNAAGALAIALTLVVAVPSLADRQAVADPIGDLATGSPYCPAYKDVAKVAVKHAREGRWLVYTIRTAAPIGQVDDGIPAQLFFNLRGPNDFELDSWITDGRETHERAVNHFGVFTSSGREIGQPKVYDVNRRRVKIGVSRGQLGNPRRYGWVFLMGCGTDLGETDAVPDSNYAIHRARP